MSDASNVAVGAMLAQIWDGYEHPVSYYSKALNERQRNWHPFELETYACLLALRAFRHYITAAEFIIVTDCKALTHFNSTREVSPKIVRWLQEISQYGAKFIHRKGEHNVIPDWQSRDCSYLNELEFEEMKELMAKGVHSTPLTLYSQRERVEDVDFHDYEKGTAKVIKHIKSTINKINMSKVAEEQRSNTFCQQVVEFFTSGKVPPTKEGQIEFMKKVNGYTVRGGLVYKIPSPGERHPPLPYVAGIETRQFIMKSYHDKAEAAHPGEHKMRKRILQAFWWPTLTQDVKEFCKNCVECPRVKPQVTAKAELQPIKHKGAWEFVSLDHLGKLPKTKTGHTHVLVMIDRFTRWVELIAIRGSKKDGGLSAETTLKKLKKRVIDRYGMPVKILTDGSTSFKGVFEEYAKENKVKLRTGKAYKHDTNGMAERIIRTVEEKLRLYVNEGKKNWNELLSIVQAALNSHEAWGPKASPFFLNHGFERNTGTQNQLLKGPIELPASEEFEEMGLEREAEHELIMEEATRENHKSQEEMKRKKGKSAWLPKIGDHVMVNRPSELKSSKLEPLSDGPFEVLKVDKHGNCTVGSNDEKTSEPRVVPASRLSKFRGEMPKEKKFLASENIDLRPLLKLKDEKITEVLEDLEGYFGKTKSIAPKDMIGLEIDVYWNQPGAKGWWSGTIVDYDSVKGSFLVKYDSTSKDGEDTYYEKLLSSAMPRWRLFSERK